MESLKPWAQGCAGTVNIEHPFQPLSPGFARDGIYAGFAGAKTGHGPALFSWRFVFFLQTFRASGGRYQDSVLAVWRKNTMKPCEIDLRFGHQ